MSKRNYYSWHIKDMEEALEKYNNKELKFNEVCRLYNIPKPTFRRHLKGLNKHSRIGHPRDLTEKMEDELARHVLKMEENFFGMTPKDLREAAYKLAETYQLNHRLNKVKRMAGFKWYYNFMHKHPEISLRTPEATSMARCKGFNKEIVMKFFDKYESLLVEGHFTAEKIYNVDETGLCTVHKPSKVLARKGKHQIGAVTSGERGVNTTCICCMNAAGEFIPPMLIFKRKRMADDLKRGGPPNASYKCSDKGWITCELFVEWLEHFIKCLKLEKNQTNQILLILDGHTSHTKNLDAINLARDYGIVMLSLPPHTTHKLQPLDKSFFKSLKHNFNVASDAWMRNHPGSVIKQSNIAEILGTAYPRAVCMDTALHGFASCGLWPCDRFKIRDEEYVILHENDETEPEQVLTVKNQQQQEQSETALRPTNSSKIYSNPNVPETEELNIDEKENVPEEAIRADLEIISPKIAVPVKSKQGRMRKTASIQVLTESPYKRELQKKIEDSKKKSIAKNFSAKKDLKRNNIRPDTTTTKKIKTGKQKDEDWFCKLCNENLKEDMIQCSNCQTWIHELCAGTDKKTKNFLCDDCTN